MGDRGLCKHTQKWNVVLIDKLVLRQEDQYFFKCVTKLDKMQQPAVVCIILAPRSLIEVKLAEGVTETVCNKSQILKIVAE